MAANDKVILKLTDLVTWITHDVDWIAGSPYKWKPSIQQQQQQHDNEPSTKTKQILSPLAFIHNQNVIQRTNESSPFLTLQRYISSSCKIIFNKRNMNINEYNIDTKSSSSSSFNNNNNNNNHHQWNQLKNGDDNNNFRSFQSSRVDFTDIIPLKLSK